jgi:CRISPR-associated protein Cas5d
MQSTISLRVWGPFACFTRPENKVERVSYDVITPSAARGVLEAIYWKPQIRWVVDRLHVLQPIRFTNIRRNEVGSKVPAGAAEKALRAGRGRLGLCVEEDRQQRAATVLRDVEYAIEGHFDVLGGDDAPAKHFEMFKRRAEKGQCFHRPYLGCREFACHFVWLEDPPPRSPLADTPDGNRDLGFMLHDIDFANDMTARFFHAVMKDGVVDVPPLSAGEALR